MSITTGILIFTILGFIGQWITNNHIKKEVKLLQEMNATLISKLKKDNFIDKDFFNDDDQTD